MNYKNCWSKGYLALVLALFAVAVECQAAVSAPEALLPDDTLVLLTVPDFPKLVEIFKASPQSQFWNDSAMKPFREKFVTKWKDEFVKPLERELNINFQNYTSLLNGQVTLALTQNGPMDKEDQSPGLLFLLDTCDKSAQLKTNLADLRKKWVDAGKAMRTEKIRNFEFSVLPLSTNDVPKTLRRFFPQRAPVQEAGAEEETKKAASENELVIGQADSLLVVGSSLKVIEKVVARLTGGSAPSLGEQAAYDANHQALFRNVPAYGWVNVKAFVDLITHQASEKKESDGSDPLGNVNPAKIIAATGLAGLKTLAFTFQSSKEGLLFQFFLGVPESGRQGIFKILAGEAKDSNPPAFVPADAVKFQRWRVDGQKTWATLEKMFGDISPQWAGALNFLLDAANTAAKEKDPAFDIKKTLIANLGDDLINYEKAPRRGATMAELRSPPSLFLLGSPNPEQLAAALRSIMGFLNQQSGTATEREFLGRKIFTAPVPNLPLPMATGPKPAKPKALSFAATAGYVAMSTEPSMLEEYLRSSDSQGKTLRETPGLTEAAQKVIGPGTALFGFQNQVESMRASFELLKKDPGAATNTSMASLQGAFGVPNPQASIRDWADFSLLPSFDKIAKYFYFSVYGGSANGQGLALKYFAPTPPQLRGK